MEAFSCKQGHVSVRRRRSVVIALLSPFLLPHILQAQPATAKTWRIGFVSGTSRPTDGAVPAVFRTALQELGFEEGRQVTYEGRWIEARQERLPAIFAELLALHVDVIVTQGAPAAAAAKRATSTVPIVALNAGDVADTGLVASLAKPGGNVTGVNDQSSVLSGKRLELLREAIPSANRVAVLWNAGDPAMTLRYQFIERAGKLLGIAIDPLTVREPDDFDAALAGMDKRPPDALMMVADALTNLNRQRVIDYAAAHRIPAIYEAGVVVQRGGLMSYGDDTGSVFVLGASYVARILRGAKPSDLPVEQPNRYFLVINLKTARALGLAIPTSLRLRADELIE